MLTVPEGSESVIAGGGTAARGRHGGRREKKRGNSFSHKREAERPLEVG